jgi:hypothetical protein
MFSLYGVFYVLNVALSYSAMPYLQSLSLASAMAPQPPVSAKIKGSLTVDRECSILPSALRMRLSTHTRLALVWCRYSRAEV